MKKLLFTVIALIQVMCAVAQDVHFTQYMASPLTLNPAMTGLVAGDFRATGNYRTQWGSVSSEPYVTKTLSYDMAILKGKLPKGDAIGVGVLGLHDKSGSGGLTNLSGGLSVAYHKALGGKKLHHLSIGLQALYVQKTFDFSKLTFEEMYNRNTGQLAYPVAPFNNSEIAYADYNAGIMYSGKITSRSTLYAGYSVYHLTQPRENFLGNNNYIHSRQTINFGSSFDVNKNLSVYANGLYQSQASASELLLGASAGIVLDRNNKTLRTTFLYLGGWYRYGDAVAPYLSVEWSDIRLGLSYDINVSSLTPASHGAGAYEISLTYGGKTGKKGADAVNKWIVPKMY